MIGKGICPVCGSAGATPVIARKGFRYVRCDGCGAVYVDPMPSAEEAKAFYQDPAYFSGDAEIGYRDYAAMHRALAPHFRRRLRLLARWQPRRGRLLDVGCADGYFLELARAEGWEVAEVEVSERMAKEAARRLQVPVVTALEELPPGAYDVLTLWEVVEHFPQPVVELRRLVERLRPGGLLMLSTPNAGHWQALHAPERWTSYRLPAHLVLFTADSLRLGLEQAGLVGIRIWKTAPLPPLPWWLERATAPLAQRLADGSARPWRAALLLWRAVRLWGWAWQRIVAPHLDIFMTLEALACRPG